MSAGSPWAPMLPVAMVGTDRQPGPLPRWPGEVGGVMERAAQSAAHPASGLLRAAGVLAVCGLAGAQGAAWTQAVPSPSPEDAWPPVPEGPLRSLIAWSLAEGPPRLVQWLCLQLGSVQHRLPHTLLPAALEAGRRSIALRAVLLPVLDQRGLWLAAQRDEWRYAGGADADTPDAQRWTDGSLEQRREVLLHERRHNPAAARERYAAALEELPAKERAELLAVLAEGLGPDDEALLDRLRADRSREVRQVACQLLLRLPTAAHPQRASARLAPLLKHERVLLRKRWQIDAPAAEAADWKADNVDAARPKHETLGERAWWLYQLVRQVPLGWWTTHTELDAPALIAWAHDTDWAEALLRGWRDVLLAAPEAAWCNAFLDHWPAKYLRDDPATVLALLPPAARERHWLRHLGQGQVSVPGIVQQVLTACAPGESLSRELSARLVDAIVPRVGGRTFADDYALRALLPELCCALHHELLPRLSQLAQQDELTPSMGQTLHAATQVVAVRQALHSFITSRTP